MNDSGFSTFELISVRDWCSEVRVIPEMLLADGRNKFFSVFPEHYEKVAKPDFYVREEDIAGIDCPGRIFGYHFVDGAFEVGEVFLACLENVMVKNDQSLFCALFVEENLALAESVYNKWVWEGFFDIGAVATELMGSVNIQLKIGSNTSSLPVKVTKNMAPERVIEEPCVMLGNNPNYFHWTLEALSRLWCLDILRELSDLPVVVPANPPPHVIEMLQVLGFSPDRLIFLDKKAIKFRKLYFPSYLAGSAIAARQVEYVRQRLLKGFKVGKTLHGRNRYYLRRSDARVRRISNDDEVVVYLDSLGFESICPGQMTVRQQVEAFAEAEIVVAPHGAGNVNMIYAPADATLVEIMPASSRHPLFWMMTKLAGQKYGRIICQDSPVTQDMTIDMTSFSQLMQKVVGSYQAKFISTSKIGQEYGCIQGPFSGSFSRF